MSSGALATSAIYEVSKFTPSLLYNNLSTASGDGTLIYASRNTLAGYAPPSSSLHSFGAYPAQICSVHAPLPSEVNGAFETYAPLFVVVGETFADLYINGRVGGTAHFPETTSTLGGASCSAITVVAGTQSACIMVGTSIGCVVWFDVDVSVATAGSSLTPAQTPLNVHQNVGVTAVDVRHCPENTGKVGAFAISGDASGEAVLWNYDRQPYLMIPSGAADCVSGAKICSERNLLVAIAYGGGKVNVHSTVTGALEASICAHALWINALAYTAARGGLLASAGEDSVISVWALPAAVARSEEEMRQGGGGAIDVKHVASTMIDNWIVTGIAFAPDGSSVTAACYDSPVLRTFKIP